MLVKYTCSLCVDQELVFLFSAKEYRTGDTFEIYRCLLCKNAYTKPEITEDALGRYYGNEYYGNRKGATDNIINFFRIKKISKCIDLDKKDQSVLDVGCGNGSFLLLLQQKGWVVYGTEIATDSHLDKKIMGRVCKNHIDQCKFQDKQFDLITMWHSLEHLQDPVKYLQEANRLLKDDGFIFIEVPNFDSWEARIFKDSWFHLDVPRHTHHLSPNGLIKMLEKSGFTKPTISYGLGFIYELFGITQSLLNLFSKRKNLLFDLLNGKLELSRVDINIYLKIFITIILMIPAIVITIPIFFAEALFKKGSIVTIYATKAKKT